MGTLTVGLGPRSAGVGARAWRARRAHVVCGGGEGGGSGGFGGAKRARSVGPRSAPRKGSLDREEEAREFRKSVGSEFDAAGGRRAGSYGAVGGAEEGGRPKLNVAGPKEAPAWETPVVFGLLWMAGLVVFLGTLLAASSLIGPEFDAWATETLYPNYSYVVLVFLLASSAYGGWKAFQDA